MSDRNKSLCENSMKMVANFIKLSSFSIAKMSLGAVGASATTRNLGPVADFVMLADKTLLSQFPGSKRSEKPQNSSKPVSFLLEPSNGNESAYVIHEEKGVIDANASDYITKVHQKNRRDLLKTPDSLAYVPTPPPPPPRRSMT